MLPIPVIWDTANAGSDLGIHAVVAGRVGGSFPSLSPMRFRTEITGGAQSGDPEAWPQNWPKLQLFSSA
jgi:hypothetical protein